MLVLVLGGTILAGADRAQEPQRNETAGQLPFPLTRLTNAFDFSLACCQEPQQTKPANPDKPPLPDAPKPKSDSLTTINPDPNNTEGKRTYRTGPETSSITQ